jgi:signal transduction histidine kinase
MSAGATVGVARVSAPAIRVVIADDSPELRMLLRLGLDDTEGLHVAGEASDGAEALALVEAIRPDVVLLDVAMPIMDGLEALEEIGKRYAGSVPVVIWSGFSASHLAERALSLGASAYVEKTGDLGPVATALRRAVLSRAAPDPPTTLTATSASLPAPPHDQHPPIDRGPHASPAARGDRALFGSATTAVAISVALFALIFLWRLADPSAEAGVGGLYVLPVGLLAAQFGRRVGVLAAGVACLLWWVGVEDEVEALAYVPRFAVYLLIGLLAGWSSDRLREGLVHRAKDAAAVLAANRRLAEAIAQSEIALDKLAATNADLNQFMHVASHDLAEPLRTMSGFSQLVSTRYADGLDDSGQEFLAHIVAGAARMQALLDDLRSFTRASQQPLHRELVDLDGVVADVRAALGATLRDRHAEVAVDNDLPCVLGDSTLLGLVLQNLISNAVKFNQSPTPTVRIASREVGDTVVIDVADNGIGIEPEHRDRVFDLFQRLHTRDDYTGTGLGLAICRRILGRHGGSIGLTSTVGVGTTFTLTLPAGDIP